VTMKGNQNPCSYQLGQLHKFQLCRDFDVISAVDEASAHGAHEFGDLVYGTSYISGSATGSGATSSYVIESGIWEMQLRRALRLSSDGTTCHGACFVSVY
jgi:hypothetical protein